MEIKLSEAMRDALTGVGHVPDDLRRRFDAVAPDGSTPPRYLLNLSDDEAMELSELLQWHVRTDPATGHPTPETAPFAEIIQTISDQQF